MSRLRFVPIVVGAIALHSAVLAAQKMSMPTTLASFTADSARSFSTSPDGRFVVQSNKNGIGMYDVTSHKSWKLADGEGWEISWSPAGNMIAYVRAGSDNKGEYVWALPVDAKSGQLRGAAQRVTTGQGEFPSISPDGHFIAFAGYDSGQARHLAIVPATGGPERVLARFPRGFEGIYWSLNGKTIYLNGYDSTTSQPAILKISADGGTPIVIRSESEWIAGMTADRRHFVLVPAKARIAVGDQATVVDTAGHVVGHAPLPVGEIVEYDGVLGDSALLWITATSHSVIETRSVTGGNARRIPLIGESNGAPVWSPDGKQIAFQAREGRGAFVVLMNADGTNVRAFRDSGLLAGTWALQWSPDSRFVAFKNNAPGLSLLDVRAGTIRTLLKDEIGIVRWRSDGQAVLVRSRRKVGAGIYEVTLQGQTRLLMDWPLPTPNPSWQFVGDTSIFMRFDTAGVVRSFNSQQNRRLAGGLVGSSTTWAVVSHDLKWAAGPLVTQDGSGWTRRRLELVSLVTGARTVLDLPFSFSYSSPPEFMPDNTSLLVLGMRNGEPTLQLYRVPLNGDTPRVLASVGATPFDDVLTVSASPDGQSVAYSVQAKASVQTIKLIDLRSAIPRTTSRPPHK